MGDSVQKNRREIWSQEALSTLRKAVEAQPGGDSDMDWAEVAQKLGFTVDRGRRKWSRMPSFRIVTTHSCPQTPPHMNKTKQVGVFRNKTTQGTPLYI